MTVVATLMVKGFLVGKMKMMLGTTRSRQIRQQYRLPYAGVAEDILVPDVRVARDGDMAYERCAMVNNNRSSNFGDESVS
ncbi:unnamed protein product [Lactuca virosa]|uniref:Uncharacterized protein n=1 Tax=Lactuca virosa TaxID=75947 RepID=A0AAU9MSY0_9ASTR|nr:unnamed protein product [Lactuca virosa]